MGGMNPQMDSSIEVPTVGTQVQDDFYSNVDDFLPTPYESMQPASAPVV